MPNYISPTAASDGLYREWLGTYGGMVYEPAPDFAYTERHLKCVWYDSRLRPEVLRSAARAGDYRVRDIGIWRPARISSMPYCW